MKQKTMAKRDAITNTQKHNKMEMTAREDFFRNNADNDRVQSHRDALVQVEKAAYLE